MSKLIRRYTRHTCFFCQSEVNPTNPLSFHCPSCQCWNRYDSKGEIISEEPAMHDESLNVRSFARRASPRKDRFPTTFGSNLFCHTCQTNQMLASNILSNYLPPPEHPDYSSKVQGFQAYRESVELRYPPVCASCLPAVQEEIRKRDTMARASALGGFLKDSKGKGKQRAYEKAQAQRIKLEKSLFMWRFRGVLWVVTLLGAVATYATVGWCHSIPHPFTSFRMAPLLWTFTSIFWTAWDPTYATRKRDELQGRPVRQLGKRNYNIAQTLAWFSRVVSSAIFATSQYGLVHKYTRFPEFVFDLRRCCIGLLLLETCIVIYSVVVLQLQRTPTLHLVDSFSHKPSGEASLTSSRASTPAAEPGAFASLSISSSATHQPSRANPIFGLPSLPPLNQPDPTTNDVAYTDITVDDDYDEERENDPNAMDWSPTVLSPIRQQHEHSNRDNSGFSLRPQRFYPPEEPTGLENLFERTIRLADNGDEGTATMQENKFMESRLLRLNTWLWIFVPLVCALIVGLATQWRGK